jgi:hypothetical protein
MLKNLPAAICLSGVLLVTACGQVSGASSGSGNSAPAITTVTSPPTTGDGPSPDSIVSALGTSDQIGSAGLGTTGGTEAVVLVSKTSNIAGTSPTDDQVRASIESEWTAFITTAIYNFDCNRSDSTDGCPSMFVLKAPDGSVIDSGTLTVSEGAFDQPSRNLATSIESRAAAAGLDARSIEVDELGATVAIVRLTASDPAKAVQTKADQTVVAGLGLAGTLVEIDDPQGNLVSISGVSDLARGGVGWAAPKYRDLLSSPQAPELPPVS